MFALQKQTCVSDIKKKLLENAHQIINTMVSGIYQDQEIQFKNRGRFQKVVRCKSNPAMM